MVDGLITSNATNQVLENKVIVAETKCCTLNGDNSHLGQEIDSLKLKLVGAQSQKKKQLEAHLEKMQA